MIHFSKRARILKIERVVETAESLLEYRLNRLSDSLLEKSIGGRRLAAREKLNGITSLFEQDAKVIRSSIEKLEGSDHPLLNYAKKINSVNLDESNILNSSLQLRSMVVLLVSKAFGFSGKLLSDPCHKNIEASRSKQTALAEITEMIYAAHMLHRTVVEIPKDQLSVLGDDLKGSPGQHMSRGRALHHGNKLATLMGDLLLAKSSKGLASLRNAKATERMSDSIADFTESEVLVRAAKGSFYDPEKNSLHRSGRVPICLGELSNSQSINYDTWLRRSNLSIGSLLGQSCFSALLYAEHEDEQCWLAHNLGMKIGLVLQAYKDYCLIAYKEGFDQMTCLFDWYSLPAIYHLKKNPHLLSAGQDTSVVFGEIISSPYALEKTRETLLGFQEDAIKAISSVPTRSSSTQVLKELVTCLK